MILDGRHALFVGWVLGIAQRNGIPACPVVDDAGNYTDRLTLDLSALDTRDLSAFGFTLTIVVPPPPDDWTLP